jgi:hypothetical protein
LVNLKTKSSGDGCSKKAIEKTVLRFLGSRTFSHGLDPLPTFPAASMRAVLKSNARRALSKTMTPAG